MTVPLILRVSESRYRSILESGDHIVCTLRKRHGIYFYDGRGDEGIVVVDGGIMSFSHFAESDVYRITHVTGDRDACIARASVWIVGMIKEMGEDAAIPDMEVNVRRHPDLNTSCKIHNTIFERLRKDAHGRPADSGFPCWCWGANEAAIDDLVEMCRDTSYGYGCKFRGPDMPSYPRMAYPTEPPTERDNPKLYTVLSKCRGWIPYELARDVPDALFCVRIVFDYEETLHKGDFAAGSEQNMVKLLDSVTNFYERYRNDGLGAPHRCHGAHVDVLSERD
nr:hypothetical protein TetV2_00640 [Oceanusvirus sp.]